MSVVTTKIGDYFINMGMDNQGNFIIELPYHNKLKMYDNGDIDIDSKRNINIKSVNDIVINAEHDVSITAEHNVNIVTSETVSVSTSDIEFDLEKFNVVNKNKDNLINTLSGLTAEVLLVLEELITSTGINPDLTNINELLDTLQNFTIQE